MSYSLLNSFTVGGILLLLFTTLYFYRQTVEQTKRLKSIQMELTRSADTVNALVYLLDILQKNAGPSSSPKGALQALQAPQPLLEDGMPPSDVEPLTPYKDESAWLTKIKLNDWPALNIITTLLKS